MAVYDIRKTVIMQTGIITSILKTGKNRLLQLLKNQRSYKDKNYKGDNFNYVPCDKNYVPCEFSYMLKDFWRCAKRHISTSEHLSFTESNVIL